MYGYCTSSHMSKQFKKWPIKYHFGWLSWPAKIHIKYCTLHTFIQNTYSMCTAIRINRSGLHTLHVVCSQHTLYTCNASKS